MSTSTLPRVAIANKSKMACLALKNIIEELNAYSVAYVTTSGQELLKKLETSAKPDILIMDIGMKDLNGYNLIREIQHSHKGLKVLVISESVHPYIINHMVKFGAAGFVDVESDVKAIKKALNDVLTKGVHYNDLVTKELAASIKNKEIEILKLSSKQQTFIRMCCSDMSYQEMANQLKLSLRTIDWHRDSMFAKFDFANRTQLALFALRTGLASYQ